MLSISACTSPRKPSESSAAATAATAACPDRKPPRSTNTSLKKSGDGGNPLILENLKLARERVSERMERILASGLRLVLGTDSMHGEMAFEVQTAIRFGVSPKDALLAATARGAEALRIESRTGTLEPGKDADLIAVEGNPLEDPGALERVVFVMQGGTQYRG